MLPGLDFVIISYGCNFWAMAALDALADSLATVRPRCAVWIVHNCKTTRQVDEFRVHARHPARGVTVNHLSAYEGVFEQVINYAEHDRSDLHHVIARHGLVLNWLIKYRLPEGRYLFIDHDCLVRPGFIHALAGLGEVLVDKLFVFPLHDTDPKSLTAPMFACDVSAARPLLLGLPDVGWVGNIVCQERHLLEGGGERYYTDSEFERLITRSNFDDTLHNVVRYLLARDPGLVDRLAAVRWPEHDHVWHGGTRRLLRAHVAVLRQWMAHGFRSEQFQADVGVSSLLDELLARLDECGLGDEFRGRFLRAAADERVVSCG
jgi:hypothetical protein